MRPSLHEMLLDNTDLAPSTQYLGTESSNYVRLFKKTGTLLRPKLWYFPASLIRGGKGYSLALRHPPDSGNQTTEDRFQRSAIR